MLVSREAGGPTVRSAEWSSDQRGLQQHARLETTHWSAPQHSYGKMVAGVAVRTGGHAVQAHRQVEVMTARAPGVLRVLRASVTTSHSSSNSSQGHFGDLQLSVNPLDIRSQKERSSVGRSGALGGRRPPSRGRTATSSPAPDHGGLSSPAMVASGVSKLTSGVDIVEVKSDSDKRSINSDEKKETETNYKVNYPDNESEESFYDSCPEKDSIFKDETEQLEEWRRTSKIRRSLQFPRRSPAVGKPLDLPDNWGSVSRIKRELENVQNIALFPKNVYPSIFSSPAETRVIREESESVNTDSSDTFTAKSSAFKTKSFVSLETLNEVRGRLKTFSAEVDERPELERATEEDTCPSAVKDDGVEAELYPPKAEDKSPAEPRVTHVRSYVFGMEAMLNALNEKKPNYPGGSNSLESRVSKISNASSSRNDDWYARRKSYGFEKVGNKSENNSLTSHDKNNIESSTDSGICQSSELVNSLSNGSIVNNSNNRSTVVTLTNSEKRETFEDWLQKTRKSFGTSIHNGTNKYKCLQDDREHFNGDQKERTRPSSMYADNAALHVPVKTEESPDIDNKRLFFRKLSEGTTLSVVSSAGTSVKSDEGVFPSKRHTIAVDGIKEIRDLYEPKTSSVSKTFFHSTNGDLKIDENGEDNLERRNKKVEFCKTEVHFTAESGRVNIVESEGKPPSTNNFRRRRRSGGVASSKETDKKLPVMRFGDNVEENKTSKVEENTTVCEEKFKLNYGIITDIKSTTKETSNQSDKKESSSVVQMNGDPLDGDYPRGILKNKPVKPRPYLLGQGPTEEESAQEGEERSLWGVRLRPVRRTEDSALWKSSVLLNNSQNDDDFPLQNTKDEDAFSKLGKESPLLASASEVSKVNKGLAKNKSIAEAIAAAEPKGYSTKVNFGNGGDAVIETSFHRLDKKQHFVKSEDCLVRSEQRGTNVLCINRINCTDSKGENITTKISIDLSPTKQTYHNHHRPSLQSVSELKSTALVKRTVPPAEANMVLKGENDKCFVKTAHTSKLRELRKMYENREGSEDSADEEVCSLMRRSAGLSWGRRGPAEPPAPGGSLSWSRRRARRTALPQCSGLTAKPNNLINCSDPRGYKEIHDNGRNLDARLPDRISPPTLVSDQNNIIKNHSVAEKKQIFDTRISSYNNSSTNIIKSSEISQKVEEKNMPTFADSISTPRSLMPSRGSARKLKEHELSYFGIKDSSSQETVTTNSQSVTESKGKSIRVTNTSISNSTYAKPNTSTPLKEHASNKRIYDNQRETVENPIYENVVTNNKVSVSKPIKAKHPGESIIEELTKAADEILQALNGYSEEESSQFSSGEEGDPKRHNKKRFSKPLETISETYSHKAKVLENKGVQANFGSKEKIKTYPIIGKKSGSKNSSNSSIESIVRETRSASHKVKSKILESEVPEKPQRKKVSSVEAVKARRLHRANSRDALLQIHGSSSEDLPTHTHIHLIDASKRKSSRRSSRHPDIKSSTSSVHQHASTVLDESNYSNRSLTILPEIRHKTAVSTIKAVSDKNGIREMSNGKIKSSSKERSRRREKLQEGTISSLNRMKGLVREKSRSADTSLDRESGRQPERVRAKDSASYHGDESHEVIKYSSTHPRISSQHRIRTTRKEESQHKIKEESTLLHTEKPPSKSQHDKDRSHNKIVSREVPSHHSEKKIRDLSSHRRERSQDRGTKELHHGEKYDDKSRTKEYISRHREHDSSKEKRRERESSSHRRDPSQDSVRARHAEVKCEVKKKDISQSNKLGSPGSYGRERGRERTKEREGRSKSSSHTRTEHDKSLR